jgi:hypothetical protein
MTFFWWVNKEWTFQLHLISLICFKCNAMLVEMSSPSTATEKSLNLNVLWPCQIQILQYRRCVFPFWHSSYVNILRCVHQTEMYPKHPTLADQIFFLGYSLIVHLMQHSRCERNIIWQLHLMCKCHNCQAVNSGVISRNTSWHVSIFWLMSVNRSRGSYDIGRFCSYVIT